MKRIILFAVALTVLNGLLPAQSVSVKKVFGDAARQTRLLLQETETGRAANSKLAAPRTLVHGQLKLVPPQDWTSGFFAGELWMLYQYTKEDQWRQAAAKYTALLEREQFNGDTHDMGFKIYCSYGKGYALTQDTAYKQVIIQSARTLATRFNKTAGVIRSWDHHEDQWAYPVIIDNMMNLELLFAATRLSGDSTFYAIAVSHANTTLQHHFRSDNSSYHVLDYDTTTGRVISRTTHQGYADESAWARGQSWGLYGFTMCYRETKDTRYLQQAERIADFILKHPNLPADGIPYWDFNAPDIPNATRDASAAAILASGLYELSDYSARGKQYRAAAGKILQQLTKSYRSPIGENKGFILLHSTGHLPAGSEIDVPINYADYYYLEALLRSR